MTPWLKKMLGWGHPKIIAVQDVQYADSPEEAVDPSLIVAKLQEAGDVEGLRRIRDGEKPLAVFVERAKLGSTPASKPDPH